MIWPQVADRDVNSSTAQKAGSNDLRKLAATMSTSSAGFDHLFEELQRRGILLEADALLPSVARIIIGGPYQGSWWAHPLSNQIYLLSRKLEHHRDVLFVRLLSGKMTHIHRRMWPDFYAVAGSQQPWQFAGLPESAKALLARVNKSGRLRIDQMPGRLSRKTLGEDARLLEASLLVFGEEVHTDSGAHAKALESWEHWAARSGFSPAALSAESARERFDQVVAQLNRQYSARAFMPWDRPPKRTRRVPPPEASQR